jgi:hypothetical protein
MFPIYRDLFDRPIGGILDELIWGESIVLDYVNPMAVIFGLSVHFGPDRAAADRFIAQIQQRYRSFPIGFHTIALHPPLLYARDATHLTTTPIGFPTQAQRHGDFWQFRESTCVTLKLSHRESSNVFLRFMP